MLPAKVPSNGRRADQVVATSVPQPSVPAVVSAPVIPVVVPKKPPQVLSPIPDTAALLGSLRRRWLLAFVLGFGAMVGSAYGLWTYLPAGYTVRTLLHVA